SGYANSPRRSPAPPPTHQPATPRAPPGTRKSPAHHHLPQSGPRHPSPTLHRRGRRVSPEPRLQPETRAPHRTSRTSATAIIAPLPAAPPTMSTSPKVGFVSLGCPKALVDSERILTQLRVEGYEIVPSYDAADVVVVN